MGWPDPNLVRAFWASGRDGLAPKKNRQGLRPGLTLLVVGLTLKSDFFTLGSGLAWLNFFILFYVNKCFIFFSVYIYIFITYKIKIPKYIHKLSEFH